MLPTKVTHLRSLLLRQKDGVSSVVRKVYLAITVKLAPTKKCNYRITDVNNVASTEALVYIC